MGKYKDFCLWVANEIFDDYWEFNKDGFDEIACRKLVNLGIVELNDGHYTLISEDRGIIDDERKRITNYSKFNVDDEGEDDEEGSGDDAAADDDMDTGDEDDDGNDEFDIYTSIDDEGLTVSFKRYNDEYELTIPKEVFVEAFNKFISNNDEKTKDDIETPNSNISELDKKVFANMRKHLLREQKRSEVIIELQKYTVKPEFQKFTKEYIETHNLVDDQYYYFACRPDGRIFIASTIMDIGCELYFGSRNDAQRALDAVGEDNISKYYFRR